MSAPRKEVTVEAWLDWVVRAGEWLAEVPSEVEDHPESTISMAQAVFLVLQRIITSAPDVLPSPAVKRCGTCGAKMPMTTVERAQKAARARWARPRSRTKKKRPKRPPRPDDWLERL